MKSKLLLLSSILTFAALSPAISQTINETPYPKDNIFFTDLTDKYLGTYYLQKSKKDTAIKIDYIEIYKDDYQNIKCRRCFYLSENKMAANFNPPKVYEYYDVVSLIPQENKIILHYQKNEKECHFRKNGMKNLELVIADKAIIYEKKQ